MRASKLNIEHKKIADKERALVLAVFSNGPIRASRAQQMLAGRVTPRRVLNLIEDLEKANLIRVAK